MVLFTDIDESNLDNRFTIVSKLYGPLHKGFLVSTLKPF